MKADLMLNALTKILKCGGKKELSYSWQFWSRTLVWMRHEQLDMTFSNTCSTLGGWKKKINKDTTMKKVLVLSRIELSKRKLVWQFFFAYLKPQNSKSSATSAADRNSWKFWARHFSGGHLKNIPSSGYI